jgi:cytidylate kinase
VRSELVRLQREAGLDGGLVTEGRDQGSVVFPDAEFKFYLDASSDVRARRRQAEAGGDLDAIRAAIERRDAEDRSRPVGALVVPPGAIRVDTSGLTLSEVVDRILAAVGLP